MPLQDAAMTMALNKALFKGVVSEFSAAFQLIKCMSHPLMGRDESSFRAYQGGVVRRLKETIKSVLHLAERKTPTSFLVNDRRFIRVEKAFLELKSVLEWMFPCGPGANEVAFTLFGSKGSTHTLTLPTQLGCSPPPLACQGANQLATILNAGFRANRRVIAPVGYGCVYMPARLMEDASSHLGPLIILFSLDSLGNMWGFKYDFKRWRYTQTILVAMKDGTVYKTAGWTSGMEKQMERMAANPRECLHSWMRSNCCVFCLRTLTYIYDVFHGFGGNCGRRYGLDAVMGE
eukprot:jgi/Mesvir1/23147/Mv04897-RA.1